MLKKLPKIAKVTLKNILLIFNNKKSIKLINLEMFIPFN